MLLLIFFISSALYNSGCYREAAHTQLHTYKENILWLKNTIADIPPEVFIRRAAALGAEVLLLKKVAGMVSKICDGGLVKVSNYMQKSSGTYTVILDGMSVQIANSASEHVFETVFEPASHAQPKKIGTLLPAILGYVTLEEEIVYLRLKWMKTFPGSFPFKHVFEPEVRSINKSGNTKLYVSGWHHDYKRVIFNTRFLNGHALEIASEIIGEKGVYKLEWGLPNGKTKRSTFFPSDWTRDQVLEKIDEVMLYIEEHKIPYKPQPQGGFAAHGFTKEGIRVRVVKDVNNEISTVFPTM